MSTHSPIPQNIAKYNIEHILGSGAMGVVYKGYDSQIERPVAIKVLHQHLREGEHGQDLELRFLQEAKAAARCLHPNIVTIFDFGNDDAPYIVMEFVEGIELKAHLKSDIFISLPSATDITIQVLDALNHAHEKGIVHRDIKPANIILLENGTVKVSDFGVARLDTSELTSTGFMVGTPNYMSPEGLQGRQVDGRSDIYSTAVLFFELLTRERPSKELELEQNLERLNTATHLSGQNVRSIKPILKQALQPNPTQRYQSAQDFINQLKAIDDMDLTLATTAHFPKPNNYVASSPQEMNAASSSQWSDDVLNSLEQSLARFVGPMAKFIVKKNSRSASSIDQLLSNITQHIPNEEERSQFRKSMEKTGISQAGLMSSSGANLSANRSVSHHDQPTQYSENQISEPQMKAIAEILTYYVGPLAGRLVKKHAKQCSSLPELIQALGERIPDRTERLQFMDKANKV